MSAITPFRIDIPQTDLDDLHYRLAHTRFVEAREAQEIPSTVDVGVPTRPGWEYGVPLSYVVPLLELWRDGFDWRAQERRLNVFPQFITEIDEQRIHFVHVISPEPDATPLLLVPGWPSSFTEFLGLVPKLTDPRSHAGDPASAFHVVIPSYPGYAFSGPARVPGWRPVRTAAVYHELMLRLGYDRYGVHGNDVGAIIAPEMGRLAPEQVIGVHVGHIYSFPRGDKGELDGLSTCDLMQVQYWQQLLQRSTHHNHAVQPQTLAHALSDSPVGQLALSGQLLADSMPAEEILTNISIHWFTNTSAPAVGLLVENNKAALRPGPTTVPLGLASFTPGMRPVRRFAERDHANIVQWNEFGVGGRWPAHQAPDLLLYDIREFFAKVI
ncbi:epoxide hydrolase family protein [Nocardia sp. NPDC046763]|uniref:epoxide hydrolase family protein n=1 Tax=Nocardia sp. NPDC046763 TaxID=3155256 RepID=UPI00340C8DF7